MRPLDLSLQPCRRERAAGRLLDQSYGAIWLFSALLALGVMVDYFAIIPQIVAKSRDLGFNPPVLRCEGNGAFTPAQPQFRIKKDKS